MFSQRAYRLIKGAYMLFIKPKSLTSIHWAICPFLFLNLFSPTPAKTVAFVILFCVTPDDFTRQGRASGWELVNPFINSPVHAFIHIRIVQVGAMLLNKQHGYHGYTITVKYYRRCFNNIVSIDEVHCLCLFKQLGGIYVDRTSTNIVIMAKQHC